MFRATRWRLADSCSSVSSVVVHVRPHGAVQESGSAEVVDSDIRNSVTTYLASTELVSTS